MGFKLRDPYLDFKDSDCVWVLYTNKRGETALRDCHWKHHDPSFATLIPPHLLVDLRTSNGDEAVDDRTEVL